MLYRVLADVVVGIHLLFIVFVVIGGVLAFRWPRIAWVHVPAFLWGAVITIFGGICPLTYLENDLRKKGAEAGYSGGFFETYILPVLYPELFFTGGFPRSSFISIGVFVLALNVVIYWRVLKRQGL